MIHCQSTEYKSNIKCTKLSAYCFEAAYNIKKGRFHYAYHSHTREKKQEFLKKCLLNIFGCMLKTSVNNANYVNNVNNVYANFVDKLSYNSINYYIVYTKRSV